MMLSWKILFKFCLICKVQSRSNILLQKGFRMFIFEGYYLTIVFMFIYFYLIQTSNVEVKGVGIKTVFSKIFGNSYNGKALLSSRYMSHRVNAEIRHLGRDEGSQRPFSSFQKELGIFFIEFRLFRVLYVFSSIIKSDFLY